MLAGGCISIGGMSGGGKPPSIYTLRAAEAPAAPVLGRDKAAIEVPKPELPAGFESQRIAILFEQGHRLDYYADSKWSAPLDALLQDFIVQRGKATGFVIGTPDIAPSARYRLAVKFTDFEPVYADTPDKAPRLDVGMIVTVTALPGGAVKTQFTIKKSAMASENRMAVVTAELAALLQSATDEALQRAAPNL
jgi:ABC-type uncharacterized transport system auxiliary subunit